MSAETTVRAGRAAAERLMTDTAAVTAKATTAVLNEHGEYDDQSVPLYEGACKVKVTDTLNQDVNVQGRVLIVQRLNVDFPINDATIFPPGTHVTMTASRTDTALVGRKFRTTGPHSQTYATARRYPVEEII